MNPKTEKRFENTSKSKTFNNIVRTFGLDKKRVLDIGCTFGEFVARFGTGSTGVTITPSEAAYGQEKGLDIRCGNIESDSFVLEEKYDVIFANNLFEHLYSTHNFLRKIRDYLEPGGILILGVPCIPKVVSLLRFKKFQGSLSDAHVNFFTRDTLIKTVEAGGWTPSTTRGFHFTNPLVDHLFDPVYPHFYVIAVPNPHFTYSEKRMKELVGYINIHT
ncbi:MAG: class I SAM-dependent methyltransferase [Patescibacteria group bacterium]